MLMLSIPNTLWQGVPQLNEASHEEPPFLVCFGPATSYIHLMLPHLVMVLEETANISGFGKCTEICPVQPRPSQV